MITEKSLLGMKGGIALCIIGSWCQFLLFLLCIPGNKLAVPCPGFMCVQNSNSGSCCSDLMGWGAGHTCPGTWLQHFRLLQQWECNVLILNRIVTNVFLWIGIQKDDSTEESPSFSKTGGVPSPFFIAAQPITPKLAQEDKENLKNQLERLYGRLQGRKKGKKVWQPWLHSRANPIDFSRFCSSE